MLFFHYFANNFLTKHDIKILITDSETTLKIILDEYILRNKKKIFWVRQKGSRVTGQLWRNSGTNGQNFWLKTFFS